MTKETPTSPTRHEAENALVARMRKAVEDHKPSNSLTQWYVDDLHIDCDADEFWLVVAQALCSGGAMPGDWVPPLAPGLVFPAHAAGCSRPNEPHDACQTPEGLHWRYPSRG